MGKTKVIYITPDYDFEDQSIDDIEGMPSDERLTWAKNANNVYVYSLEEFQMKFNNEEISDLGYIYFV